MVQAKQRAELIAIEGEEDDFGSSGLNGVSTGGSAQNRYKKGKKEKGSGASKTGAADRVQDDQNWLLMQQNMVLQEAEQKVE